MQTTGEASGAGDSSLARALMAVHTAGALRRSDLTAELGLTRTATGSVLRALEGLLLVRVDVPDSPERRASGRPSHLVGIHEDAPRVVCVQVEAGRVLVGTAGLGGVLFDDVVEVSLSAPESPVKVVSQASGLVIEQLRGWRGPWAGVGVAMPSAVGADGEALAAHVLRWPAAVPVAALLSQRLGRRGWGEVPVRVANDANVAALAEFRHGTGRGASNLLYLSSGQRGVGGGLVVHGRPFVGSQGYALEVGHMTVRPDGRPCHCGSAGCLDVETDVRALLHAANRGRRRRLTTAEAVFAGAATDTACADAVADVTERLGIGLANLVNVFNPDRVVLSGFLSRILTADPGRLRRVVSEHSFLDQAARVEMVSGSLEHPGLSGAAELAFQQLLDDPRGGGPTLPDK